MTEMRHRGECDTPLLATEAPQLQRCLSASGKVLEILWSIQVFL